MTYQSVNPYDGKTLKIFEQLNDEQLETALKTTPDSVSLQFRAILQQV